MSNNIISTLLAIFLTVVVVSPMLVTVADNTVEVGLFENSEEEKETRGEHKVEVEKLLTSHAHKIISSEVDASSLTLGYFFKSYPIPHLNLISPPPELV